MQSAVKCVAVGDNKVGKTALLISLTKGDFECIDYIPTIYNCYAFNKNVGQNRFYFTLLDTSGTEQYSHLRSEQYAGTDIFIVCFSVINSRSFVSITEKWIPEILEQCPLAQVLLIGTKEDLRQDSKLLLDLDGQGISAITQAEGWQLANRVKAITYMETSATNPNSTKHVTSALTQAAEVVIKH